MERYTVISCPTTELSYTNRAVLNPSAQLAKFEHIAIRYPKKGDQGTEAFVFSLITDRAVERDKIAFNVSGRKWANLMANSVIEAAPYKFIPESQCLNSITFTIDFANRSNAPRNAAFDSDELAKTFTQQFVNQAFTVGQIIGFAYKSEKVRIVFELKVKSLEAIDLGKNQVGTQSVEIGLTTANTIVFFEPVEGSDIVLSGRQVGNTTAPRLFSQDWNFASMGIGGLSQEFNTMFRRAFASRLLPPQFAQDIDEAHVKGMLLYGPPGTGKTLIARQIGKTLLAREPKVVNGPELLNKYVGESESNVRKLFAEAEEEQRRLGVNSGLHLIIFDEIDALCKARGSSISGVGDNVVNQLLTKIDGVDALNNVLLIGMTNRKDLIDEALLRPGRFDIQVEIGLPNRAGRLEILNIHTEKMRKFKVLDDSVDLEELADRTRNFTGAELRGLVQAARSIAISRIITIGDINGVDESALKNLKVTRADFLYAMDNDIKPALGASEDEIKILAGPIVQWDPHISKIQSLLSAIIKDVSSLPKDEPYFILITGAPKTGLTTLAANMAVETKFPFIRVYRAGATVSKTESAKIQYIEKLFDDASRSELSCIVIDDLRTILEYCRFGPRYSLATRATLGTVAQRKLPKGRRMLVICTCETGKFLEDVDLEELFNDIITVPSLTKPEQVESYLMQLTEADNPFDAKQCREVIGELKSVSFRMGIKKLEELVHFAKIHDSSHRIREFFSHMRRLKLIGLSERSLLCLQGEDVEETDFLPR